MQGGAWLVLRGVLGLVVAEVEVKVEVEIEVEGEMEMKWKRVLGLRVAATG